MSFLRNISDGRRLCPLWRGLYPYAWPQGEVVGGVGVVTWALDQMLAPCDVARILRTTPAHVTHLAERGAFPNAVRVPSTRGKRLFWRIPRGDVWQYLMRQAGRKTAQDQEHA